ncbi:MAG: hypothetical protein KJ950_11140 [Proteobacteria bacterium]|nr:hypothetical protein [Pseudomonadota bacterium]MBU1687686.1 hypothetical protein [Pseudomonadota bacterium]
MNDNFQLDGTAQELYRQFAGIDASDRALERNSGLINLIKQEEQLLDYYRLLLARSTCIFAGTLSNSLFASLAKENEQKIRTLINILQKITEYKAFDGKITCRLRGKHCASDEIGSETYDYELSMGNLILDYNMVAVVEKREPIKGKAIHGQLIEAFKTLSVMNIFNFVIDFGGKEEQDYQKINDCINHLVHFHNKGVEKERFLVYDEYDQPNLNLTVLAAINGVQPAALQNLVNKIKLVMLGPNPPPEMNRFTTVYDVILATKRYREQLKKMPIEVNNVQWLTQKSGADPEKKEEAVQVSRLVLAKYGSNPKMASEVLESINSSGYGDIRTDVMSKRLSLATEFLEFAGLSKSSEAIETEALKNIEEGLDQVSDEVFDSMSIVDGKISTVNQDGKQSSWSLHEKIMGLLSFFKQRSTTKKKVQAITGKNVQFDAEDFSVIARNFKISPLEASHLIELLQACFDDHGRFRRIFFEKNIPEFVKYESKVFEFLWHYLKELDQRVDRVSFLNSLQLLVDRLQQPQDALQILLKDIFGHFTTIKYSDRNGLILANILLRRSNREKRSNIELTPEEVLQVKKGLNQAMVKHALEYFDKNHERVTGKVRHLTEILIKSVAEATHPPDEMQPRFLLFLLRELVIFLGLIGGKASLALVHGMVKEFGNPHASYYQTMKNPEDLRYSLQLLQVSARSLRRFEAPDTNTLFDEIAAQEAAFINLLQNPAQGEYVKRVIERILIP